MSVTLHVFILKYYLSVAYKLVFHATKCMICYGPIMYNLIEKLLQKTAAETQKIASTVDSVTGMHWFSDW